jgi:hypothetical protein
MYNKIEGGTTINIQGLECNIPPEGYVWNIVTKQLEYRGVYSRSDKPEEQYWERIPHPDWYKDTMKRWDYYDKKKKDDDPEFYDEELEKYKNDQWDKRLNGTWIMIKGKATYLPGMYWFLLQCWPIDIGYAKFTKPHLKKFYFLEYCIQDPLCMGLIEVTKRRFLKTFIGGLFVTEYVTRTKMAIGALQSKTGGDAKKVFGKAIVFPFKKLPRFFRPEYDMSLGITPKTELRFQQTNVRGKKAEENIDKDELGSSIDFQSADAVAYDGQKIHRYFCDEWGKTVETNVFDRHEVVRYCLVDEEGRIIGKALYSTTVEKLDSEKDGVQEAALQLWDASNQLAKNPKGMTESGLYRFFQTADETKFFDIYGDPDIEKTIEDILIDRESARNPRALSARKKKEPRTIDEAFSADGDKSIFNTENIDKRKNELREKPIPMRKIIFYRDEQTQSIKWRDVIKTDGDFFWETSPDFDLKPQKDVYKFSDKLRCPTKEDDGAISVDSYSNSQGGQKFGSKASAWYGDRKLFKVTAHLYGRPNTKDDLHTQVLLCSEFKGVKTYYEFTSDDYERFFRERGRIKYLGKFPLGLISPVEIKKAGEKGPERYYGTPLTPYSLTQQHNNGIAYFEHHCDSIDFMVLLERAPKFDPYERTKFDAIVAFLIIISILMEPIRKPKPPQEALIKSYINNYGQENSSGHPAQTM